MTAVCVCLCFLIYILCKRLQGVRVNNKEKARWHSFESKNTTGTGPLNVSQPDTHKPANAEAEFKQSMQCCSQWGLTSRSRLWNVERSMIKTAERARCRAHTYLSTHSSSSFDWERDLQTSASPALTHTYHIMFTARSSRATYKFKDDVKGQQTPKHNIDLMRDLVFCRLELYITLNSTTSMITCWCSCTMLVLLQTSKRTVKHDSAAAPSLHGDGMLS